MLEPCWVSRLELRPPDAVHVDRSISCAPAGCVVNSATNLLSPVTELIGLTPKRKREAIAPPPRVPGDADTLSGVLPSHRFEHQPSSLVLEQLGCAEGPRTPDSSSRSVTPDALERSHTPDSLRCKSPRRLESRNASTTSIKEEDEPAIY